MKLSPIFLLSGKRGSGKSTLLSSLAKKHGLYYFYENCVLMQNSNPAQTEKIILSVFSKLPTLSPCILHFRNIEVCSVDLLKLSQKIKRNKKLLLFLLQALCQDESGNKDDRTLDYFIKQSKVIQSKYPVIIFCTTSAKTKLSSLQRIFLQTLHIGPIDFDSRLLLLNWISKQMPVSFLCIDEVARSTTNFVFADLLQLVNRAFS